MKNTDFELERINCMCTYKEIFDFNRIDEDTNDVLNDPNFEKAEQSSSNLEIIKCISKISAKEGFLKNESFYFTTVLIGVEVVMVIASVYNGIASVGQFMKSMIKFNGGKSKAKFEKKDWSSDMTNSNRILNNPPKRKIETNDGESNDDNNNRKNIVVRKHIKLNLSGNINNSQNIISETNNNYTDYEFPLKTNSKKYKELTDNKVAEFIPPEYNFKYFKPSDKGVFKTIVRSQIPFKINPDTEILLERKDYLSYDKHYLEGPYYKDQNILLIVDENNRNRRIFDFNDNNNNNINYTISGKRSLNNNYNGNNLILKGNIKNKYRTVFNDYKNDYKKKGKEFISIRKINPITHKITEEDDQEEEEIKKISSNASIYSLYTLMKREHTYLRTTYEKYMSKIHPNVLATFLAEIFDKIYIFKIFLFRKKFDILSVQFALYVFYHIILLSLLCAFFTISVFKKIWEDSDFPRLNFYLLYGFLGNVIIWIIYRIFSFLLNNQDRIRAWVKINNKEDNDEISIDSSAQEDMINEKYKEIIKRIRIQTAIFYFIILSISGVCFTYLVSFFAVYKATKKLVIKTYYISIIEIFLIKFAYGFSLAALRIAAEINEFKCLYKLVYYLDKYFS